jgi:signal transduction histidine kinase
MQTDRLLPAASSADPILVRAGERFTSTLDISELLREIADVAVPALARACRVDAVDRDGIVMASQEIPAEPSMDGSAPPSMEIHFRGMLVGRAYFVCDDGDAAALAELCRRAAPALHNARLYLEAVNKDRARDMFLATLSHELKTPMTAILGWAQMLRSDGGASELFNEALDAIEQSARVQERLIEDILDVSRVITGKLHMDKKPVSVNAVVDDAIEMVTPAAQQNGVRVRTRVDGDPTVIGDEMRLRQVVWNLLTNAVKFTPSGGFVEVSTAVSGDKARLSVRDSGRGIRAEALPRLFDQFHQNNVADRAQHRGLGLGLAIVRHLVAAHGGRVEAQSPGEGKGSEFIVTLPLASL